MIFAQSATLVATDYFEYPLNYVAVGKETNACFNFVDSTLYSASVKKIKLKASGCTLNSSAQECFQFSASNIGKIALKSKITFEDGKKIKVKQSIEVVALPTIDVLIDVTAPDSKFMWLKIIDKSTGLPLKFDFDIYMLDFELFDPNGVRKDCDIKFKKDDFFPSISLQKAGTTFEIKDKLEIGLSIIHKEYNLIIGLNKTFTIDALWK